MAHPLSSAELYDPASGTWTATGSLNTAREVTRRHCCPTARCWWQGEHGGGNFLSSAELYDIGLGFVDRIGSRKSRPRLHRWCWAAASS